MNKEDGSGGWKRTGGGGGKDEKHPEAERVLVQQWLAYQRMSQDADAELDRFVRVKRSSLVRAMTKHLHSWADDGTPSPPLSLPCYLHTACLPLLHASLCLADPAS